MSSTPVVNVVRRDIITYRKMDVSVVVTVLNEEKSILRLLKSLHRQTLKTSDLVIVDGGSMDRTVEIVKNFQIKHKNPLIHLIEAKGNISKGRNIGIDNTKNDIIAITDAGCVCEPKWLENIIAPFADKNVGLSAGFYDMEAKSAIQKAVAPFLGIPKRRFDPRSYLPSARSMAFRKKVWEEVGGFNETLYRAGEDTLFNYEILKRNIQIARVPNAVVKWEVPNNISEIIHKFFFYAKGDAETGIWWHPAKGLRTHNIKIMTIFARYLVFLLLFLTSAIDPFSFLLLIFGLVAYSGWSILKLKEDITDTSALIVVPIIQFMSDICVMAGFISGIYNKRI